MKCKDCTKFKPDSRMEAGRDITPDIRSMKGTCGVNDKTCNAIDRCGCGGFEKK